MHATVTNTQLADRVRELAPRQLVDSSYELSKGRLVLANTIAEFIDFVFFCNIFYPCRLSTLILTTLLLTTTVWNALYILTSCKLTKLISAFRSQTSNRRWTKKRKKMIIAGGLKKSVIVDFIFEGFVISSWSTRIMGTMN